MAAGEFEFVHGDTLKIDYTPAADHPAGEAVVFGDLVGVAPNGRDGTGIKNGKSESLDIFGGVWAAKTDAAIAVGKQAFWDAAAKRLTETAAGNNPFGPMVKATGGADEVGWAAHLGNIET